MLFYGINACHSHPQMYFHLQLTTLAAARVYKLIYSPSQVWTAIPLPIITAITVQDTTGVEEVLPLDAECVDNQARAILEDMPVHAFKLGLLGSVEIIAAIAEIVSDYPEIPLIMDPVLASGRGDELANEDMIDAVCSLLLPQVTLLTPNSMEARRLILSDDDQYEQDELESPAAGRMCLSVAGYGV